MRINAIFAQVLRTPADGSLRTSQPNLLVRREHANRHEFLSPGPTTTAVEQLQKTNCKSLAALPDSNKSSGFLGGKKLLQSFVASIEPCLDAVDINCRASFFPNAYALSCSLQQACEMLRQKSPREQRNLSLIHI